MTLVSPIKINHKTGKSHTYLKYFVLNCTLSKASTRIVKHTPNFQQNIKVKTVSNILM